MEVATSNSKRKKMLLLKVQALLTMKPWKGLAGHN